MEKISGLVVVLLSGAILNHPQIEGSYVAQTLNGHALPAELRLPGTEGDFRLFKLEQGVLRLSPRRRFTLYFRYYHQLVRRGARPVSTPVLADSETGTYRVEMGKMILTPETKRGSRARAPIAATLVGEEIRASYLLESGTSRQRITLTLHRDPSFW